MGLITALRKMKAEKASNEMKRLFADLLQMARADGEISEDECDFIFALMDTAGMKNHVVTTGLEGEGVTLEELLMYDNIDNRGIKSWISSLIDEWSLLPYPKDEKKRLKYLLMVISMMITDGESTQEEIILCHEIARRMGFDKTHVYQCLLYLAQRSDISPKQMSGLLSYYENGNPIIDKI